MREVDRLCLLFVDFYVPVLTPLLDCIKTALQLSENISFLAFCRIETACIRYRGNVYTEPLPSNDKGMFTEPLPSNDNGMFTEPVPSNDNEIFTEPLPSNDRGIFTEPLPSNDRVDHRQQRDLISLLLFFQNKERLKY
jgi:hypothetical protein